MNESGTSGYLRRGFNRYMVECEFVYIKLDCIDICVLIDTWWNVNISVIARISLPKLSFNRYMVECEFCLMKETISGL